MRTRSLMAAVVVVLVGCKKEEPVEVHHVIGADGRVDAPPVLSAAPVVVARVAPPAPPARLSPYDVILTKKTATDALDVARPLMAEKFNDTSPGSLLLSLWALQNLTWADVSVASNETTFARVMKDSESERGKRLCVGGALLSITAAKQPQGTLYVGLLKSVGANLYHFAAVKSTGDLVQHSTARFCGFVTGRYDYENSGGGTSHAIDVVGMFSLKENRAD